MSLAVVYSRARLGIQAPLVTVEVHISNGLPALNIVGMPELAVRESRDRVRSAIINSQFDFPARRITINLAPADLPKSGSQFDLAIALGILAASNQVPANSLANYEFYGELALNGEIRPVNGALPAAITCQESQRSFVCPTANANEVALCEGGATLQAGSLLNVCAHLHGQQQLDPVVQQPLQRSEPNAPDVDLSEVKGQSHAKRALEIAAAGGHHLLMIGPPGTGKSMLAARLPTLLPPLTSAEAIELASVLSINQSTPLTQYPQRPFCNPHHTASAVALVGGGSQPTPGEISLAHHGVLFLDELPEFQRHALEVLREPLETGTIRISRACAQVEYPAQFQLVAAMNPCPCGFFGQTQDSAQSCRCSPDQVRRYRHKISGPLIDRIDLHVPILPLQKGELYGQVQGETSARVQARVTAARERQMDRQGGLNQQLQGQELHRHCALSHKQQQLMENAMLRLGLSARAVQKVVRSARTIADLSDQAVISDSHLAEAFSYRVLDRTIDD